MTLSCPSALAAATRASMPPQAEAESAVLAVDSLQEADPPPDEPPQAATSTNAITARPSWRTGLLHFMLFPLVDTTRAPGRHRYAREILLPTRPTLQGRRRMPLLISVSQPLKGSCGLGTPGVGKIVRSWSRSVSSTHLTLPTNREV